MPAGIEKLSTLGRKPDFTRVTSGDSARKKPGMPMLNVPMSVSWRGKNGNGLPIMPITKVSSTAYAALVTNRLATRSTLLMTLRPSLTTIGSVAKASLVSTRSAADRVAALPEPIAIPRSASLSANTSLTPSPVMATTWPSAWSAWTIACF